MKNAILYLWQLPQNLLGLFIIKLCKAVPVYAIGHKFYRLSKGDGKEWSAFTLGKYILVIGSITDTGLKHEHRHTIQSKILGWFYLPLVALPSVCLFWYKQIMNKDYSWYHSKYPENWADRLGGVK